MPLNRLSISGLRNLQAQTLTLHQRLNILYGENGSGKTSLLEAIYLLGLGRSFRHHQLDTAICHTAEQLMAVGWLEDSHAQAHVIGIEKTRQQKLVVREDGKTVSSLAMLAEVLPVQLIHPTSEELLQGSPRLRRQWMDWNAFHVEHGFLPCWQRLQRLLKQRNAALKAQQPVAAITCWDEEFAREAEQLSAFRAQSLQAITSYFVDILQQLWPQAVVTLTYQRGWPQSNTLLTLLQRQLKRDLQTGYTSYGPHRDELLVLVNGQPAAQVLSRGEQKLVVIALRLVQAQWLKTLTGKNCLFLLDDIAAELDKPHRSAVGAILSSLEAQVMLTTIALDDLQGVVDIDAAGVFHVEQGRIMPVHARG